MYETLDVRPSRRLWAVATALACAAFGLSAGILGADVVIDQSQAADVSPVASEPQTADPNLHYAHYQRDYLNWLIDRHIAAQAKPLK